jgi:CheY-like chemotaxis protein
MAVGHLLESSGLSPAQEKYVRILRSSSQGLLGLVDDILDFNRMEAGKLGLDEKPFALRPLLEEVTLGQRVRAEQKGVELAIEVDAGCPEHLVGDRVKVGQILNNLIGNAVKFTEKGAVRVAVTPRSFAAAAVVLGFSVADSGIGISADRLPHVFEGFTQASPEVTSKYGGTGLGLAITQRLVELHGSTLSVESELGRGSVFSFDLRLGTPVLATGAPAPAAADDEPLAALRVLIADDNEVNLVVLGGLLRGWGAAVDVAHDGQGAVERVRGERYDAVLMDLRMPTVDGFAAMRQIRALPGGGELAIIAVSASMRMGESSELEEAGFTDFIGKPVSPELLLDKILRYVPARAGSG